MSDLKTKPTGKSVDEFLESLEHPQRKADGKELLQMMKEITKLEPKMWGPTMVGFGSYHYKYASGREGDWFKTGFSPRKRSLSVYIMTGLDKHQDLLKKLGKYTIGKGCLYINKLSDVNKEILREIIKKSFEQMT